MKKILFICAPLCLLVLFLLWFFVFRDNKVDQSDQKIIESQFLLYPNKPDVFLNKNESGIEVFNIVNKEISLEYGSNIKTGEYGRASILSKNGSITNLGAGSEISLLNEEDNVSNKIKIKKGAVWSRIEKVSSGGYVVETENMVGSVRGTAFATVFENKTSYLYVLEGVVAVVIKNPVNGNLVLGDPILVSAGNKISISSINLPTKNKDIKIFKITDTDMKKYIIEENWRVILGNTNQIGVSPLNTNTQNTNPTSNTNTGSTSSFGGGGGGTQASSTEPEILSINPSSVTIYKNITAPNSPSVTIRGNNLNLVKNLLIDLVEVPFQLVSNNQIIFNVPSNFEEGLYYISINYGDNKQKTFGTFLEVKWDPPSIINRNG